MIEAAIDTNQLLPQSLAIVNKPGAGTTTGSRYVKNANPDGYTILLLHEAILTAKYSGKVSYGPEEFEPIAGTGKQGLVIAVADDSPHETLIDLLTEARDRPDKLVFSANLGAPVHFVGSMLEQRFPGARFRFMQSGGGPSRLTALKGKHADVSAFSIEEYIKFREEGIRAIAYCDEKRHPAAPETPTSFEQGIPVKHINMQFWWAPKGTPKELRDVIANALEQAMQTEQVRERMAKIHCEPIFVRDEAMQLEVEALRTAISKVDLRATRSLPNVPAITVCAVGVLGCFVGLQSLRDRKLSETRVDWADYAVRAVVACAILSIVYVLAISSEVIGFRAATFVYVVLVGAILTRFDRSKAEALLLVAVLLSGGTYVLFTKVFSLILP
jgi:tripartite-type tricarboxylate transporter receptor subunit TctC